MYFHDPYIPQTEKITAKWRGPSVSKDFNQFVSNVYNDLISLVGQINGYNEDISVWNEVLLQENKSLKRKINAIEAEIDSLKESYGAMATLTNQRLYHSYSSNENVGYGGWDGYPMLDNSEKARQDLMYGQVIPANASAPVSKLYIYDILEGVTVVPTDITTITPTNDTVGYGGSIIKEADSDNAIDGNDSTYYYRVVEYTAQPAEGYEEIVIEIKIPRSIVNSLRSNYVAVHPFPEYGIIIQSVTLQDLDGTQTEIVSSPVTMAGRTRFLFVPRDVDAVTVTLRNSNVDTEVVPGKFVYMIGVSNIGVGNIAFAETSRILTKFKLYNNKFRRINEVGPSIDGIAYNVWYYGTDGNLHRSSIGSSMPVDTNTVWIESILTVRNDVVPVSEYLYIDYTPWKIG